MLTLILYILYIIALIITGVFCGMCYDYQKKPKRKALLISAIITVLILIVYLVFGKPVPKRMGMVKVGSEEYYQMLEEK